MEQPTLTFDYPQGPLTVSVRFDRWDGDRAQFWYQVASDGNTHTGADLRLGSGQDPTLGDAMRCLLDFFGAFAEAVEYEQRSDGSESENGSLFSPGLRDVAYALGSDRIAMLARDVVASDDD